MGQTTSWYKYTLGTAGNRTKVVESTGRTVDYEYDSGYKLTKETIKNVDNSTHTISYTYDAVGNRLTRNDNGTATSYTYDKNDRLTNEGSITYSYDTNGNLTLKTNGSAKSEYTYDFDNRLTKAKITDINAVVTTEEYQYDWAGNRVQKKVNSLTITNYIVNSNGLAQVIEEKDGAGNLICYYTRGDGELISQKRGSVVNYYLYDGFGSTLSKTGTTVNNYLYTNEQYDSNTGFYYLRARYMNPTNGRFISMDTYSGSIYDPMSLHKYMYANASPVNYTDPTGHESLGDLLGGMGMSSILDGIAEINVQCLMKQLGINIIKGALMGADFGGVDAILGGGSPEQIVKAMRDGAISGAVFGAMATFAVMRPILLAFGMDSGIQSVEESIRSGNYAQAAFRALALIDTAKDINGDLWEPTSCFTGDTKVDTEDGNKEIKEIKVGDEVYSENPETGEKGLKKVTKIFVKEVTELVHITAGGEEIKATATHPFWVVGAGWTEAGDLKVGDKLEMYSGEIIEVTDVFVEKLDTSVKVYNLEVEDWHTYFVSDNDVFVHNMCKKPTEVVDKANSWNTKGTWGEESLQKHFDKHGKEVGAESVEQYLRKAEAFKQNLKGAKTSKVDGFVDGVIR